MVALMRALMIDQPRDGVAPHEGVLVGAEPPTVRAHERLSRARRRQGRAGEVHEVVHAQRAAEQVASAAACCHSCQYSTVVAV